ncbi:hypothetical protein ThidrDRAFT_3118 [Thiorhodococcus drewsii AZ1]|uniref:Uncharacterized protein n=1 Tax=Thiorhodococcus drewsii AZ1 TaxID=765913 RepID=G2E4A5_9GAMM|nr:Ig-like domain-containing protein [Thiorhodococcus drewsii]EGV29674.1 hypothetical protein ThidrDRAFT_3118 [Thiorhodococcus drewsii AZ1]
MNSLLSQTRALSGSSLDKCRLLDSGRTQVNISWICALILLIATSNASVAAGLDLPFMQNQGQFPQDTLFVAHDGRYSVSVRPQSIRYEIGAGVELDEIAPLSPSLFEPRGAEAAQTRIHDFRSNDPTLWLNDIPSYRTIRVGDLASGISLELIQGERGIEKVIRVEPGAQVSDIALTFAQPHRLALDEDGTLTATLTEGGHAFRFSQPIAFQEIDGERVEVAVAYRLMPEGGYGFQVGAYDAQTTLVIDPTLVASTLIGGDATDSVKKVVVEAAGTVVVAGQTAVPSTTDSNHIPTVTGGYDSTLPEGSGNDIFVARLDAELSQILDFTFLGSTEDDRINALQQAPDGSVYLSGNASTNAGFPTTENAYQRTGKRGWAGFVSRLSSDLSRLMASTVFDVAPFTSLDFTDMALDSIGNVFLTGRIAGEGLPATGYDTSNNGWGDVLLIKFDANLTNVMAASYLGGSSQERGVAILIDNQDRVYVTGTVHNANAPQNESGLQYDFPTTSNAWMPIGTGCYASFVSRFDNDLSELQASTFIGVEGTSKTRCGYTTDYGEVTTSDFLLTESGHLYVAGGVDAQGLPLTGGFQPLYDTKLHYMTPFVLRMDSDLTTVDAVTHFGGAEDQAGELALTPEGNILLAGETYSNDLPTTIDAYQRLFNLGVHRYAAHDIYFGVFNPDLSRLLYATLIGGTHYDSFGGVDLGPDGSVYLVGDTLGTSDPDQNFPTTAGTLDQTLPANDDDGFIARLMIPEVLSVSIKGTGLIIPGTEEDFELTYRNTMRTTAEDAVVVVDIPAGFEFVEYDETAQYYAEGRCENQLFWSLGNLPTYTEGKLYFKMRVPSGTPTKDFEFTARISASNDPDDTFDVSPYLDYQGIEVADWRFLSLAEAEQSRQAHAKIEALYTQVLRDGYAFSGTATHIQMTGGREWWQFYLIDTQDGTLAVLSGSTDSALIEHYQGSTYSLFDQDGGFHWNRGAGSLDMFGASASLSQAETALMSSNASSLFTRQGRCNFNCMINTIPDMALGKINAAYSALGLTIDCVKCADAIRNGNTDETSVVTNCSKCTANAAELATKNIPGVGDLVSVGTSLADCHNTCAKNPDAHICTKDRLDCTCFYNWVSFGLGTCRTQCNKTTGMYAPASSGAATCPLDEVCDAASCNQDGDAFSCCVPEKKKCPLAKSCATKVTQVRASHDPNAKLAEPAGAALAGSELNYRLQYENTGEGDALGVFVIDRLSEFYDASTLQIDNGGTYDDASRLLSWQIGDLNPGEFGEVSFRVQLDADLPDGTVVSNQAEVFFPNALETTLTNLVVHEITSLAAHDQRIQATAGTAVPVMLNGQGGSNLTYEILSDPLFGTLNGTLPQLGYTAESGFSGVDRLTFRVLSGSRASAPATITFEVAPDPADTTPPAVISVTPERDAIDVPVSGGAIDESRYTPAIEATFSEDVDTSEADFSLDGVSGTLEYDAAIRTLRFWPANQLAFGETYTAYLSGVIDLNDNVMDEPVSWSFSTGFDPNAEQVTLRIETSGTGSGRVTSTPAAIDCGTTCSASRPIESVITLNAEPSSGSTFGGWSGACSDSATSCELTLDEDTQVGAQFDSGWVVDRTAVDWQVAEIYLATMGYAPDSEGLDYWVNTLSRDSAWTPTTVAQSFFDQPLVQAAYPGSLGYGGLIEALYRNIFDREADTEGYGYWLAELESGRVLRNQMIIALINGGWANPDAATDMARFGNRIHVSLAFAAAQRSRGILYGALDTAGQSALRQAGQNVLWGVTSDTSTIQPAIDRIDELLDSI